MADVSGSPPALNAKQRYPNTQLEYTTSKLHTLAAWIELIQTFKSSPSVLTEKLT